MRINTNVVAQNALGNLNKTNRGLSSTFQTFHPACGSITPPMMQRDLPLPRTWKRSKMSLRQAQRNTNDGISVIQTAEGATNEVADMLKRMRELAVQSSSETLANSERAYIDDEFKQLTAEVDRISQG